MFRLLGASPSDITDLSTQILVRREEMPISSDVVSMCTDSIVFADSLSQATFSKLVSAGAKCRRGQHAVAQ